MPIYKVLLTLEGRIGRTDFWFKVVLPVLVLTVGFLFVPSELAGNWAIKGPFAVLILWLVSAGMSKRLKDRNHSGWLLLLVGVPVVALESLNLFIGNQPWVVALWFVVFLIALWQFAECGFIRGTLGLNRYGEDPRMLRQLAQEKRVAKPPPLRMRPEDETEIMADANEHPEEAESWPDSSVEEAPDHPPPPQPSGRPTLPSGLIPNLTNAQHYTPNPIGESGSPDEPLASHSTLIDGKPPTPAIPSFGSAGSLEAPTTTAQGAETDFPPQSPDIPPIEMPVAAPVSTPSIAAFAKAVATPPTAEAKRGKGSDSEDKAGIGLIDVSLTLGLRPESETRAGQNPDGPKVRFPTDLHPDAPQVPEPSLDQEWRQLIEALRNRATEDPASIASLEAAARGGNRWAKLEIAASWLLLEETPRNRIDKSVAYLRGNADAKETATGIASEAAYFVGEIFRLGFRNIRCDEDLAIKYLTRAASLGNKTSQFRLANMVTGRSEENDAAGAITPFIDSALKDRVASDVLMQMIEADWSLTFKKNVQIVLRTMVDRGNKKAAKIYGRFLLEDNNDLGLAARILRRTGTLDTQTIDTIMDLIEDGTAHDDDLNALMDCIQHHAERGNPYAHFQMSVAFNTGVGVPQDDIMAFVHANLASARVHGQDREDLIQLREDLKESLSEDDIAEAQDIIRRKFLKT